MPLQLYCTLYFVFFFTCNFTSKQNLDERERRILTQRRLVDDPLTLDQLSKSFGISRERVRQVEVRAFEKLRKVVKNISYKTKNFSQ